MERRVGNKFFTAYRHNEVPHVICLDLVTDKAFLIEGGEEVQALREVLAGLGEPKESKREFYPGARVRIIGDTSKHGLQIDTIGVLMEPIKSFAGPPAWVVEANCEHWYIYESDMELLEDDGGGMSE